MQQPFGGQRPYTPEQLDRLMGWIAKQEPLFLTGRSPAARNPFQQQSLPEIEGYSGNSRLGFVYQALCRQLFAAHPSYRIVADEVQLQDQKRTIGALDFLLEHQPDTPPDCANKETQIEHWEVALKFYLYYDGLWHGPDPSDRLDLKLSHMLNHQLALSATAPFQQRFPNLGKIVPRMLIQGRLYTNPFHHESTPSHCLAYPLNQATMIGYWCFERQCGLIGDPLYQLEKVDWLTGTPCQASPLEALNGYARHCQSLSGQFWIVVPDSWPQREVW